jgi:hypothetical protein
MSPAFVEFAALTAISQLAAGTVSGTGPGAGSGSKQHRHPEKFAMMTGLAAMLMLEKRNILFALLFSLPTVYAFLTPSNTIALTRGPAIFTKAKCHRASLTRSRAVAAENLRDGVEKPVVGSATETGRSVPWKDASPQRTVDKEQISWINQFPNTWQPAEKLLLSKDVRQNQGKETISTAGSA